MADLTVLQRVLGIFFNDRSILKQALVHSSYINENPGVASISNERLEFLGDAILGYLIAEKLYQDFPHLSEGKMTKLRAALVRRDCLVRIARTISLGDYLALGRGEEASGGRGKPANLASALEAVIAAISIDQGLSTTRDFISRSFADELQRVVSRGTEVDYKSQLQEVAQARWQITPTYQVVEVVGPDHDKRFTVEVRMDDKVLGRGSGKSKKMAETEAARLALQRLSANFTL